MTFGSSYNRDFDDLLINGWTMAALFDAVADALLARFPDTYAILGSAEQAWMADVLRNAVGSVLRPGAPRPRCQIFWEKAQPNRVRLHLEFP